MTTPGTGTPTIEEVEVVGNAKNQTIGVSGDYRGRVMVHRSGRTDTAIGNGRRYLVEVTDGVITEILVDFALETEIERKADERERMRDLAATLAAAQTYGIAWESEFHDHTPELTMEERSLFVKRFLQDAPARIESSSGLNRFTLLVTDPKGRRGSHGRRWRLCGRIDRVMPKRVLLYLWHYGPGSRH